MGSSTASVCCRGLVAATVLIVLAAIYATPLEVAVVSIYVVGLLAMLVLSATYNLWPVSQAKWVLRRFDHSSIYVLIAATYTPFIAQMKASILATGLLIGVWCLAAVGIVIKLLFPGRFDRLAVVLYLGDGLERLHGVRHRNSLAAELDGMVHRRWRAALQFRNYLSRLATVALSKTRSGTASCCWARPAIIRPCLISF